MLPLGSMVTEGADACQGANACAHTLVESGLYKDKTGEHAPPVPDLTSPH